MKIYIIGTSGSGKTTLARLVAKKLNIKHVQLDELYWLPNWSIRPTDDFITSVKAATEDQHWVVCGNYRESKAYMMEQADQIVWLDFPFWRVFLQAFKRTIRHIITQTPIAGGNQETFYQQFFTRRSLLLWVIQTHHKRQRNYIQMMTTGNYKHKWVRISTPGDYERYLQEI